MTRRTPARSAREFENRSRDEPTVLPSILRGRRAALIIAHPGHELRIYQWLKLAQPTVFVLTDGSGRSGRSRLHRTSTILREAGATPGPLYGRVSDGELYAAILRQDAGWFIALAIELAGALDRAEIEYIVGDAIEGYNPAHDLCRYVTNTAAMLLARDGRILGNYDILLAGRNQTNGDRHLCIELDGAAAEEKLRIARAYTELQAEVDRILAAEGAASQSIEQLRPVDPGVAPLMGPPYYEQYGRQQIARGHYHQLITYCQHIRPFVEALQAFAEKGTAATCGSS